MKLQFLVSFVDSCVLQMILCNIRYSNILDLLVITYNYWIDHKMPMGLYLGQIIQYITKCTVHNKVYST